MQEHLSRGHCLMDICMVCDGHLYGSRTTLVRLTSDACAAREQHLHGSQRVLTYKLEADYQQISNPIVPARIPFPFQPSDKELSLINFSPRSATPITAFR